MMDCNWRNWHELEVLWQLLVLFSIYSVDTPEH